VTLHDLPTLNATLNGISALLLVAGYRFIRARQIARHRFCMLAAFGVSIVFLTSYLIYHAQVGSVRFPGTGFVRLVYFAVLIPHTILAATVPPLAVLTLVRALQERFDRHRRIARWTFPIWLYVSVTGVIVYWMLYHLAGAGAALSGTAAKKGRSAFDRRHQPDPRLALGNQARAARAAANRAMAAKATLIRSERPRLGTAPTSSGEPR
jgi:putative membrane protein